MPQVIQPPVAGLMFAQGPNGPVKLLAAYGSPNSQASLDVQLAALGSHYMQLDGADASHILWVCSTAGAAATSTTSIVPSVLTNNCRANVRSRGRTIISFGEN